MSKNNDLLVFVFSDSCGACTSFKQSIYPRLIPELKNVKYVELNFPEFSIPKTGSLNYKGKVQKYHPDLHLVVEHFPFIFFVDEKVWNNSSSSLKIDKFPAEDGVSKTLISNWIANHNSKLNHKVNSKDSNSAVDEYETRPEHQDYKRFRVPTYGEYMNDRI